jgi:hypothetical protein
MGNRIACFIGFLGLVVAVHAQGPGERVSLDLKNAGFLDFVKSVERQTGIHFYFQEHWIEGVSVNLSGDSLELEATLGQVLSGTGLYYYFLPPDRLVILPEKGVVTDISHLTRANRETTTGERSEQVQQLGKHMEVSKPEQMVQTIVIGSKGNDRSVARISGRIRDLESGQPVIGATMVILETGRGSVSDQYGKVEMSLVPGRYNAQFSFIGMSTFNCQLEVLSDGVFQVEMRPEVIALNEVQIVGSHYRDINSTDVGVERLSMKSVKKMPLFMGENDVIKISKLLPGITSSGEASVGVNVRGGSADQNIFYINRVPIYNTSHMFGFLSAFNSDIVHDFSVYKGNVPANYGGRLSSVFNIITRKGNLKNFSAHAGISPVSAHATLEGPIVKEKASYLVSGRTSYSDWMLQRMEDPLLRESRANFYDFTGSVHFSPGENNSFNAFYYQSYDRFAYGDIGDYDYGNRGGSLTWQHTYSPAFSSTVTSALSEYSFGHVEKKELSSAYGHDYRLNHDELIVEFSWVPALKHSLEFGSGLIFYQLDRGKVSPFGQESLVIPFDLGIEKGLEGSLFLSDNITLLPWLSVYAGLRYSMFTELGPKMVRTYEAGLPKTESTVSDSIYFGKNEAIRTVSGPEIRTAMNFKAGNNTSFKLSYSQMRQYLFMLTNTVTISPTDQWKLTDYHISPPTGNQFTMGVYHIWPRVGVSGSVELYYKHTDHVVEFRDGANFIGSPYTETLVLQGEQNAYGAEFMLQKTSGRLDGWISYAYSRSMVRVTGENEFESINRGDPYPSNYDRPHVLNLIWSYHFNRRFTISSNLVYMTGRPVTYPSSLYHLDEHLYIDYYAKNQVRVPDYFRVDASLSLEGNLKADKLFHSTWSLNVYNALGRNNPQSIFFEPEPNYLKGFSFSVIGVPIVTVAWNIKMGNYESN